MAVIQLVNFNSLQCWTLGFQGSVLKALDQEMGGEGKEEPQGLEFLKWAFISQKAWHNEAGVMWF